MRANFSKGLDLVAPKGLRTKPWLELDRLLAEDWHKVNDAKHESQSQAFGRAAHDIGAEALLVPSACVAGGMNLVYFPQSLGRGSKVEIFGENDLSVANCYSRSNWRFEQAVAAGLPGVIV